MQLNKPFEHSSHCVLSISDVYAKLIGCFFVQIWTWVESWSQAALGQPVREPATPLMGEYDPSNPTYTDTHKRSSTPHTLWDNHVLKYLLQTFICNSMVASQFSNKLLLASYLLCIKAAIDFSQRCSQSVFQSVCWCIAHIWLELIAVYCRRVNTMLQSYFDCVWLRKGTEGSRRVNRVWACLSLFMHSLLLTPGFYFNWIS